MRELAAIAACLVLLVAPGPVGARSERSTAYRYVQLWPTVVRHLRVDEGFKIVEKDAEAGYVLFEVKDDGKVFTGSLEIVTRGADAERRAERLVLTIAGRPDYMEALVLDRLQRKLRAEHGDELPRLPPPSEKKPAKPARLIARRAR